MFTSNKKTLSLSVALVLATGVAEAAQITAYNSVSSTNNNFSMVDSVNALIGGSYRTSFTWDGTVFNANSDYTGPGGTSNATAASPDTFYGYLWTAHTIQTIRPRHLHLRRDAD